VDQERYKWRAVVNAVMNHSDSIKCWEFLDYLRNKQLLKDSAACSWLLGTVMRAGTSLRAIMVDRCCCEFSCDVSQLEMCSLASTLQLTAAL
jgi:hypothetical protein